MGVTLPEPTPTTGVSQRMRGMGEPPKEYELETPLAKLPETGKKIIQMLGGQIGLKLTEPETYKQINDISKIINEQPDKLSKIAKAHELLTGEPIKQSLKEMGKPTIQPWEKTGFTYQFGKGEIEFTKLPKKFDQAQALAQQAMQFSTSGKIGDVMQTVARDVVLGYLVGYGLKTLYKSGLRVEETWVSGKKLEAAVKRAQKAYISETGKFKATLSDNDFRIIKAVQGIVRTTGVKAGEVGAVKVPQQVFLGQAGKITNLVKIIQAAGKITPEVTKQIQELSPSTVTQVAAQLAPALASEFLKAVEKPKMPTVTPKFGAEHPIHYYTKSKIVDKFTNVKTFKENIEKARKVVVSDKGLDDLSDYDIEREFGSLENYYNWVKTDKTKIEGVKNQYNKFIDKLPINDKTKSLWKKDPENFELNYEDYLREGKVPTAKEEIPKVEKLKAEPKPYTATVYRGTKEGEAPTDEGLFGKGTYYTTNKEYAETYGEVLKTKVKLANPFIINNQKEADEFWNEVTRPARTKAMEEGKTPKEADEVAAIAAREFLEEKGYDGIVAKDIIEKGDEVVVFHPEKVEPRPTEPPPKEPWEPMVLPTPEVPKLELEFKEPNVHKYYMPKDQLMREIGVEPLTRPLMLKKEALMLKKSEVKKWVKDVFKEVKAKAPFAEKLKAGIFNLPTKEVARFRDLLNTYEYSPDFMEPKTKEIFDKLRTFTKTMLNDANEMRVKAGLKPITDFGAYVPHFLDELARKIRLDDKTRKVMEGIAGKKLPKSGNPTALQRTIGAELDHIFSKDLEKLLMVMAEYDLKDIYLAEPYAIYRAQMKEFEKEGIMPEEVRKELEDYIAYDIFDKRTSLDKAINATLKPGTDIANLFLKPFNRVITDPVRSASSIYRFGVMGGAIAGKVRMLTRNSLQRSLDMCIYGPQALIKGQFVAPKDLMEKIRNLDVYKLSVRKFEDIPATIPWVAKPIAKAVQIGLMPYAKTHAGLTYLSNVDVSARTAFFWGEKKVEWQKSEGAMEYTKNYAKKMGIKEGTQRYKNLFWRDGDAMAEVEEGIGATQWFYFPTRMPRAYRGQAARAFWSLNSWWMNYWGRHFREMMSRCRGVTGRGRILTRWERLNAFKGLAIILGIGEAVRRKYQLRTSEFLAFVFPVYIYPHLYQVMVNTYDALTATVQSERDKAQAKLKYNLKMLSPFSGALKEYAKFLRGEITLKEYLFYVEKVKKGEMPLAPSGIFDEYEPSDIEGEGIFDKHGKETPISEDVFDKYKGE